MAKNKNHHLEKRGDVWHLITMVRGKRIKKALSMSITEARRLRDKYLNEINVYGDIQGNKPVKENKLFGEVVEQWAKIMPQKVKSSTMKDYRGAMNYYVKEGRVEAKVSLPDQAHLRYIDAGCWGTARMGSENDGT